MRPRDAMITFGPETIAPGTTSNLSVPVEMYFQGEGILNGGDDDGLWIVSCFVGHRHQPPPPGASYPFKVPEKRAPRQVRHQEWKQPTLPWPLERCNPGLSVTLSVENRSKHARQINIWMLGCGSKEAW